MTPPENEPKAAKAPEYHALLHEMIRSFVTLARTLNLSHAVKELGNTRQTVRRHITNLEEAKGVELFSIEDRQYQLTEAGRQALPEALDILARGNSWLNGQVSHVNGLQWFNKQTDDGWSFWQQQRPISELWASNRPILRESLRAWALGGGALDSDEMSHVRPYFMVFRDSASGWVCVELGEESSYVSWFGLANARSSIGRNVGQMPGGDDFARLLNMPFAEVQKTQNVRLDHIHTQIKREESGALIPISYQRLLLGSQFPDGSFALVSVVDRCFDIDIYGLDSEIIHRMPADMVMSFGDGLLKYER